MSNSQSRDVFACGGAVSVGTALTGTAEASGLKLVHRQKHQAVRVERRRGGAKVRWCLLRICPRRFPSIRRGHQEAGMLSGGRVTDRPALGPAQVSASHLHPQGPTSTCSERSTSSPPPPPVASPPPAPPLKQETESGGSLRQQRSGSVSAAHREAEQETGRRGRSRLQPAVQRRAEASARGTQPPESSLISVTTATVSQLRCLHTHLLLGEESSQRRALQAL